MSVFILMKMTREETLILAQVKVFLKGLPTTMPVTPMSSPPCPATRQSVPYSIPILFTTRFLFSCNFFSLAVSGFFFVATLPFPANFSPSQKITLVFRATKNSTSKKYQTPEQKTWDFSLFRLGTFLLIVQEPAFGQYQRDLTIKRARVAWESRPIAAADFSFPEKNDEYEKLLLCAFFASTKLIFTWYSYFFRKNTPSK